MHCETRRRLGDRLREHFRDVERSDWDASKPVARRFNLPNHSKQHMEICNLSLHPDSAKSRKNLEQKFLFHNNTLNPHGINKRFSFKYFILVFLVTMFPPVALLHFPHIDTPQFLHSLRRNVSSGTLYGGLYVFNSVFNIKLPNLIYNLVQEPNMDNEKYMISYFRRP